MIGRALFLLQFQDAALYGDLTVRETVQVAVETRARARLAPVVLG